MNDDDNTPTPASTPDDSTSTADQPNAPPAAPDTTTSAATTPTQTETPALTSADLATQYNNDDMDWQQAIQAGKITPKTYGSMFADKSTPGKIGTLFGLLLSGAGSGLAHQSNAVMDMMNNTIKNDLEAQKSSKENAMNFLRMTQAHELQQYQQKQLSAQTALQTAQAGAIPSEVALRGAQTKEAGARAGQAGAETRKTTAEAKKQEMINAMIAGPDDESASLGAHNKMLGGLPSQLQNSVNNMPPGPSKDAAGNLITNTVMPAVAAKINQNNQLRGALNAPDDPESGTDKNVISSAMRRGIATQGIAPNSIPENQAGQANAEQGQIATVRSTTKRYVNAYNALNTPGAGQTAEAVSSALKILGGATDGVMQSIAAGMPVNNALSKAGVAIDSTASQAAETLQRFQQWRAAQIATLGPEIARLTTGQFRQGEANAQIDGLFPSIYDMADEKTRKAKFDNTIQYFKGIESNSPVLDRIPGAHLPFPNYQYTPMEKSQTDKTEKKESASRGIQKIFPNAFESVEVP
jgi:hypothetical protein